VADARELIADIRAQLKSVEDKLFSHIYLIALEAGQLPKEELRRFAGEQYYIINSDLRSIALLLNRHAHLPSRNYLLQALQGEAAARAALVTFAARAVEMSEDDLRAYDPLPGCQAYPAYVAWLALYGSDADFAFFDMFAQPAPQFQEDSLRVIQDGLDRGLDPRGMARAACLIQAYELMYWNSLYDAFIS